jgi:hypothetical protein
MPLKLGRSNIGSNITELEKPSQRAPAGRPYDQALAIALKKAGVKPKRAVGGRVAHAGALKGSTPGRADALSVSVPDGAYIIPADVVSALGDGNTASGFEHLARMFPEQRASGGATVPCKLSDGEFMVFPKDVAKNGGADAFDKWVVGVRKADIKRRSNLPEPVKE